MTARKCFKNRIKRAFLRYFFAIVLMITGAFGAVAGGLISDNNVYAEPDITTPTVINPNGNETGDGSNTDSTDGATTNNTTTTVNNTTTNTSTTSNTGGNDECQNSLGSIGWLVCPTTGKIAEAVDWLYERIEGILVINPIEAKDGQPIYEIWKYCRGLTNIVFIIFLLVVIYSQITGIGISNYGLKKSLPKLIVAAVLVNLSFLICQLGVDLSNVIGNSLRGVFTAVQETAVASMDITPEAAESMNLAYSQLYGVLAGGSVLAIGAAVIAFETGAIWMLIPIVLGAIVAVASGLITIALRQAVVALLVMIAPLAIVANILPNTENLFKKWKDLLIQMLIFYPMFSLLFGASSLAGFALIASAKDAFWLILGLAVQVFPLFFSWSLMKMSGTVLGTINTKMRGWAERPIAGSRSWADSRRQATKAKHLAAGQARRPSLALMQYMSNRRIAREAEMDENMATVKNRGLAYRARKNYKRDGSASREGIRAYSQQAENMRYAEIIERDKNNMNKGLGTLAAQPKSAAMRARLQQLDIENVNASDNLKIERARGAMIEYRNAEGFHKRVSDAMDAHYDLEAIRTGDKTRKLHGAITEANVARYETMKNIMEGNEADVHFAGADAAHAFNAQAQIVKGKFQNYFDLTTPTQDVVHRLQELTMRKNSSEYMDPIIAGLRTLNMRGDTDLIRDEVINMMSDKKIELGTYASQSLASFLMFDVKGNDPFLRRLGKYINLETAAMYNDRPEAELSKRRTKKSISMYEYVNGEYIDEDEEGHVIYEDGRPKMRKPKRGGAILIKGTSFKDMERTAIASMVEAIRKNSVDPETGEFDYERFKKNEGDFWNAIMPNIISDQFSFLSGSEQIMALGKGITGVDVQKHGFDWEGIFGKDVADSLTPEQKKDYIKFLNERTKTFLGGHVPSQIAKTKTDMLESIRNQYVLNDMINSDPSILERSLGKTGNSMSDDEYKRQEKSHLGNVKKAFVDSFKEDALKGFVKMHHKGYQGEAKDGLIQLLEPDELYKRFFADGEKGNKNNKNNNKQNQRDDDDDDDGMPVDSDSSADGSQPVYSEATESIRNVFESYRGARNGDVEGFWAEVKDILASSHDMHVDAAIIEEIEQILPQCTNVAALYSYIINRIFGGF